MENNVCGACANFNSHRNSRDCQRCSRYWTDKFRPMGGKRYRSISDLDTMALDAIAGKGLNLPSDQWLEEMIKAKTKTCD